MYIILGFITWAVILLVSWYDYERSYPSVMDDVWDVIFLGGLLGAICAAGWPLMWIFMIMLLLTRWIYTSYRSFMEPDETEHD